MAKPFLIGRLAHTHKFPRSQQEGPTVVLPETKSAK